MKKWFTLLLLILLHTVNSGFALKIEKIKPKVLLLKNYPHSEENRFVLVQIPSQSQNIGNKYKVNSLMASKTSGNILRLSGYYFLLYFFTVVYNVANKRVLNELPLPTTLATVQLFLGIPLFLPIWMYKAPKNINHISKSSLVKVSLTHALGNLATVLSLESGSVSFTHVIKAAEPVFSAIFSAFLMKNYFSLEVYASLLPIVFGVGLASAKELSFSYFGFYTGMASNFFYQLRIVLSKQLIESGSDINKISGADLFRIMTIYSFLLLLPVALLLEGSRVMPVWNHAINVNGINQKDLIVNILISGFSYYLYNEISFWILDLVHPITHAVGNTIKRVVLIVAAILIFNTPVNMQGSVGSAIAIFGSFLYALAYQRYSDKLKLKVVNDEKSGVV